MNTYYFGNYEVTELSYFKYKNIVKNLFTNNIEILSKTFNNLFEENVKDGQRIDIKEKIKILFFIRSLTLGENISLSINDKAYNLDTNNLIDNLNVYFEEDYIEIDSLTFKNINSLYVEDLHSEIVKNLTHIKINNIKKDISNFSYDEKNKILNEMTESSLTKIYDHILSNLNKNHLKILDMELNLHNGEIINFFKAVFDMNLSELYNLEYFLIKNLNLSSTDFYNYSFSELKILMNKVIEDHQKETNTDKNNAGNQQQQF